MQLPEAKKMLRAGLVEPSHLLEAMDIAIGGGAVPIGRHHLHALVGEIGSLMNQNDKLRKLNEKLMRQISDLSRLTMKGTSEALMLSDPPELELIDRIVGQQWNRKWLTAFTGFVVVMVVTYIVFSLKGE